MAFCIAIVRHTKPHPPTQHTYTHHHLSHHSDFMVSCQSWTQQTELCFLCFVSFILASPLNSLAAFFLFIIAVLCMDSCFLLCALQSAQRTATVGQCVVVVLQWVLSLNRAKISMNR